MMLSGAEAVRTSNPGLYNSMLSKKVDAESVVVQQITTDLDRTFPNNIHFDKSDPKSLQQSLFNVLLAFANSKPDVGYCQVRK